MYKEETKGAIILSVDLNTLGKNNKIINSTIVYFNCLDCGSKCKTIFKYFKIRKYHLCNKCTFKKERNHFFGKKHTLKTKVKISKNHYDVSGKNNPNYKDGKYPLIMKIRHMK